MPRGQKAQAEPEVTEDEAPAELDHTAYADKTLTATMEDYVDWVIEEVFGGDVKAFENAAPSQLIFIGINRYQHFQRSDFNKERKETRRQEREEEKAARAAAKDQETEEEEAPKPARRGRPSSKAAPAKPAGKPATSTRRGRPRKAAAQEEAAY